MKKNIVKKGLACGLIILFFGAYVVAGAQQSNIATINYEKIKPLNQGSARFCIVVIETSNGTGFPDNEYIGVLNKVNATLEGQNMLIVTPIPWLIFGTVFETNQTIYLTMEFFGGVIDSTGNATRVTGFAKNVVWKW